MCNWHIREKRVLPLPFTRCNYDSVWRTIYQVCKITRTESTTTKNAIENMKLICSLFELSLVRTFFWDFKKTVTVAIYSLKKWNFLVFTCRCLKNRIQPQFFLNFNHQDLSKPGKLGKDYTGQIIGKIIFKQKLKKKSQNILQNCKLNYPNWQTEIYSLEIHWVSNYLINNVITMAIIAIYMAKSIHPISIWIRQPNWSRSVCVNDNKRMEIGAKRTHKHANEICSTWQHVL